MNTAQLFSSLRSIIVLSTLSILGCQAPAEDQSVEDTEIIWDSWGVPHIYAKNNSELFYSFGWAQMQSHCNLLLELYGLSRGRGAEYWGEQHLQSDILIHTLDFPKRAADWYRTQDPEFKPLLDAFVKGLNDYAEAHADQVGRENAQVLPILAEDVMALGLYDIYGRFVAGGEVQSALARNQDLGSNAYAIAPSKSASNHAMLVANPHLPWREEFLFYEAHLNAPGVHIYGAGLVGLPNLAIAFNDSLGWTHTVNTIDAADLYELKLKGNGYVLDGEETNFYIQNKTLNIKTEEGILEQSIEIYHAIHGPVISRGAEKAVAIRIAGMDRSNASHQWWKMGLANNLQEFEAAMSALQIPMFNTIYADHDGNIFYLFNGHVPKRPRGDWAFWDGIVPGDQSDLIWNDIHAYEELPKFSNPTQGWLQNANDPPWTSTFPMVLNPEDYPAYMAPVFMPFRPQRAVRMMMEDESVSFAELQEYKLSTRMELADRILDDLFPAIDQHGTELAKEAKQVLEAWDRMANNDSKGAWLFAAWTSRMNFFRPETFSKPWSLDHANTTPDGLADPQAAVKTLETVASEIKEAFGSLDVAWGEIHRLKMGDINLPANGAPGGLGVFRVAGYGPMTEKQKTAAGGDSYVAIVEFADPVRAKVLLSYGNSTEKNSPHRGDQLALFSRKEYRDALLSRNTVLAKKEKTETLSPGGGFNTQEMQ